MLCFSSQLNNPTYKPAADRLFAALDLFNIKYKLLDNTKDIWLRDFMPVKTRSGRYVSFRYEPSYLDGSPELKTDFKSDMSAELGLSDIEYSDIKLDGGNAVFSPARQSVIISDRVFAENPDINETDLICELERLLEAKVIIIPSLKNDMTGHADGMVRFIDEKNVLGNRTNFKNGHETKIKNALKKEGIEVIDFPYFETDNGSPDGVPSAEGCYLNYLETEIVVFLPVFKANREMNLEAIPLLRQLTGKRIVPVCVDEIALHGGLLNCISWED
ncbi:MAG: agmatine deiminase family protein [Clostridiaceae bacterium]|nr:agmatine deiminase family protein [Clostridiaceae bacterium]